MKSSLLLEMQHIISGKTLGADFPIPCYLFVEKYGRNIQCELEEFAKVLGKENHFSFKAERGLKEETILGRFLLEEDRNAGLGKRYNGCVLIELSGEEPEKELFGFLEYLDRQQHRLSCLFTTKEFENVNDIRRQLEQFFFVRVIHGAKYEQQEQLQLFEERLGNYAAKMTKDAEAEIKSFFEDKEWKETDKVEKRIWNLVNHIVYNKMLADTVADRIIQKEDVVKALENEAELTEKKNTIGFVIGG